MSDPKHVMVWGNCQAEPLADLLREPLQRRGLEIVDVPPVFLATPDDVARVHELVAGSALLVSQPVREEYHVPGCSTQHLAGLLPSDGRLVVFPVLYYSGELPYQVTVDDENGERVNAPRTDYHDLRLLLAAGAGRPVDEVLAGWPVRAPEAALQAHATASVAELQRREASCDVAASDLVSAPGSMFTVDHPSNATLVQVAARVLAAFDGTSDAEVPPAPEREYLGAIRTPRSGAGSSTADVDWTIGGESVPAGEIVTEHLRWYADRPGLVRHGLSRHAKRAADLQLTTG
ncbi:WcbI family polysaccharide biosynthesis putative acetyltransferase [uncultured Jatrophihabitans sp.]|uniref:WcbI family polysaccharide biosynthesis putative acetyltransferase n=1 Tax=uncultured Jatrophihabitans sp. TaxID=1610747 RepID=UPI0035CBD113